MLEHPTALYRVTAPLSTATNLLHHRLIIPAGPSFFKDNLRGMGVRSLGIDLRAVLR